MKKFLWLAVVLAIGLLLLFYAAFQRNKKALRFETEAVTRGSIVETVVASGTLKATTSVDVGSQVSGIIQKVYVDFNSPVKKGQLLARIDPSTFASKVGQAGASLEGAMADRDASQSDRNRAALSLQESALSIASAFQNLETSKQDILSAESAVKSAEANLAKARFQKTTDENNFKRYNELFKNNYVSLSDKENAENKFEASSSALVAAESDLQSRKSALLSAKAREKIARANYSTAIIQKNSAKAALDSSAAKFQATGAQVKQAEATLSNARVDLGRTFISSPVDGMVINKNVDEGQTVAASFQAPVLFTIARDMKTMQVYTSVDEADIGKVAKGQSVEFTVDAYPLETFNGFVKQVRSQPVISQNVVTYYAIVETPNPDQKLKPGMTANVTISVNKKDSVLRIPNGALRFRAESVDGFPFPKNFKNHKTKEKQNQAQVWKIVREKPLPAKITTGIFDNSFTELLKGDLKEGDLLITSFTLPGKAPAQKPGAGMRMHI